MGFFLPKHVPRIIWKRNKLCNCDFSCFQSLHLLIYQTSTHWRIYKKGNDWLLLYGWRCLPSCLTDNMTPLQNCGVGWCACAFRIVLHWDYWKFPFNDLSGFYCLTHIVMQFMWKLESEPDYNFRNRFWFYYIDFYFIL